MDIKIQIFSSEIEELSQLLCENIWPYHSNPKLKQENISKAIENGYYSKGRETFGFLLMNKK